MRHLLKLKNFHWFYLCVFALLTLFMGFFHTHEADGHFHDNCPACQWESQFRSTDSSTPMLWQHIINPVMYECVYCCHTTTVYQPQLILTVQSTRAPPSVSL
ncbi:hypothetical protein JW948_18140 [bacterium]|nr:hypothetical protein [bacterium]